MKNICNKMQQQKSKRILKAKNETNEKNIFKKEGTLLSPPKAKEKFLRSYKFLVFVFIINHLSFNYSSNKKKNIKTKKNFRVYKRRKRNWNF